MHTDYNSEIPTEQWVRQRRNYVGGSDVAAILGESPFTTPLQLWMKKKGLIEPETDNPVADFGNVFEPVMASYFEEVTGLKTRRAGKPFVHPEHGFLRANIDRQILNGEGVEGTGLLELKTTTSHRLRALDGEYPHAWQLQIQWYLGLTGYRYGYLFIYTRDECEFYPPILIERDQALIDQVQQQVTRWWQKHMIQGTRPEPINGEDLLILYPDSSDGKVIEATRDAYECYQELVRLRERKTELEKREEYLKNQLKQQLGDAERLVLGGRTLVSWKSHSSRRLDSKTLRKEKPEVYSQYQSESSYRRFTVT